MSRGSPGREGISNKGLPGAEAYNSWITHWFAVVQASLDKGRFLRRPLRDRGLLDPLVDSEGVLDRITFSLLPIYGDSYTAP